MSTMHKVIRLNSGLIWIQTYVDGAVSVARGMNREDWQDGPGNDFRRHNTCVSGHEMLSKESWWKENGGEPSH